MTSYVLIYKRSTGELEVEEFSDNRLAFRRRLDLEETVPPGTEIVVLRANNLGELRSTHGRYFRSADAIAEELVGAMRLASTA